MGSEANYAWLTAFGVGMFLLLIGLGILFNLSAAETVTNVFMGLISIVMGISGLTALGIALFAPEKSGWGKMGNIVLGLIYLALAVVIWENPSAASDYLVAVLAALFIVAGAVKLFVALTDRRKLDHWGIAAITGLLTLFFGVFLWAHWPGISAIFIGTYVALEVIATGIAMMVSGLLLRQ